jgi:NAD(P)-dependent dehydrogenase (short-subunit alcohol dehydrogenase family)
VSLHYLVVGASSGLGLAYSNYMESQGRTKQHPSVFESNLESPTEINRSLSKILKESGLIDSIVFCQRYRSDKPNPLVEYQVNALSISNILENAPNLFKVSGFRTVVMVSSLVSKHPDLGTALSYQASKSALDSVAKYYALKLAPYSIRVNIISPFFYVSDRNQEKYANSTVWGEYIRNQIPLGKACKIEEIFPKITFLSNDDSSFMTGQDLIIDGGASLSIYPSNL